MIHLSTACWPSSPIHLSCTWVSCFPSTPCQTPPRPPRSALKCGCPPLCCPGLVSTALSSKVGSPPWPACSSSFGARTSARCSPGSTLRSGTAGTRTPRSSVGSAAPCRWNLWSLTSSRRNRAPHFRNDTSCLCSPHPDRWAGSISASRCWRAARAASQLL